MNRPRESPLRTADLDAAVEAILSRNGAEIVCGTPLGLGKPVALLNTLYGRVKADPARRLAILTALSLAIPTARGDLERRFLEPFVRRAFQGVPELDYLRDLGGAGLPPNVGLYEFYFRPGAMLGIPAAQQNYVSCNYTHAGRDMLTRGLNTVLVMVSERAGRYSLSCNPDLTLDVVQALRDQDRPCVVAAQVNRRLPFMTGDAEVGDDFFDVILDSPQLEHRLFGVPNPPIEPVEHAIGLRAAALVRDGGTLQMGIGSVGDSVAHWLEQRHTANGAFQEALRALQVDPDSALVAREGGVAPFSEGLFASSEMFTWGMMRLLRAGVIRRRANGDSGPILQAAFFLGPAEFYRTLCELPEEERATISMTSVTRINDFFGEEALVRRQRRDARFINICMMMTLGGAAVSDGLADGRVVSGVGGQYNFVAMAHELQGARSVLLLRATREGENGQVQSNIVFNYGHATIPRHLRDIVVTEYGVADLRGRTDAETAAALISIADSRFQPELARLTQAAGKLAPGWNVPEAARANTPERLASRLAPLVAKGALPLFPLGCDFDDVECRILPALMWLKRGSTGWRARLGLLASAATASPSALDAAIYERLGLSRPRSLREALLRRVVAAGLAGTRS
jgi:acyl-CoA hydrolase